MENESVYYEVAEQNAEAGFVYRSWEDMRAEKDNYYAFFCLLL